MLDSISSGPVGEGGNSDDDVRFFDALAEFPIEDPDPDRLFPPSSPGVADSVTDVSFCVNSSKGIPPPSRPRRRKLSSKVHDQEISELDSKDESLRSSVSFVNDDDGFACGSGLIDKKVGSCENWADDEIEDGSLDQGLGSKGNFTGGHVTNEVNHQSAATDSGSGGEIDPSSSNLSFFLAGLVVKAIGFQIDLFVSTLMFPIKLTYCLCMFAVDPFRTMRRGREYFLHKVWGTWGLIHGILAPCLYEWLKERKSFWKTALKFGWGILWACYVCSVLMILLASAFAISGLLMNYFVEKPIQIKETLNFDYSKSSPVAFVSIMDCPDVSCGMDCKKKVGVGELPMSRVIPPNHNLHVTVSLVLPESGYNRNLGIFQIRVDFLSANGKVLGSSRNPCMLLFRSHSVRLLSTLLKLVPLVAGYASEAQNVKVKFKGYTEGDIPTSCIKVTIEQRAEFLPSAGIPEIYTASVYVESQLPLLRRFLWYWKTTIYMWMSMSLLTVELILTLLFCTPILMPRVRLRDGSDNTNVPKTSGAI